jgi:hypothetical protein
VRPSCVSKFSSGSETSTPLGSRGLDDGMSPEQRQEHGPHTVSLLRSLRHHFRIFDPKLCCFSVIAASPSLPSPPALSSGTPRTSHRSSKHFRGPQNDSCVKHAFAMQRFSGCRRCNCRCSRAVSRVHSSVFHIPSSFARLGAIPH